MTLTFVCVAPREWHQTLLEWRHGHCSLLTFKIWVHGTALLWYYIHSLATMSTSTGQKLWNLCLQLSDSVAQFTNSLDPKLVWITLHDTNIFINVGRAWIARCWKAHKCIHSTRQEKLSLDKKIVLPQVFYICNCEMWIFKFLSFLCRRCGGNMMQSEAHSQTLVS